MACMASLWTSDSSLGPSTFLLSLHELYLRSMTSCTMNLILESRFLFFASCSSLLKYSSIIFLLLGWSICPPMVVISLHRHSTDSCSGFSMSLSCSTMHLCMIFSVSIWCMYSWPMKMTLPCILLLAWSSSSWMSLIFFFLSFSNSFSVLAANRGSAGALGASSALAASPSPAAAASSPSLDVDSSSFLSSAAFLAASSAALGSKVRFSTSASSALVFLTDMSPLSNSS
mmetsp:Transcript_5842/g.17589  ORF Transcript_5842/g.17589 Transcript_5842/m.17589 type:complete len:229 (-) Transcript_5842:425-1111(-)